MAGIEHKEKVFVYLMGNTTGGEVRNTTLRMFIFKRILHSCAIDGVLQTLQCSERILEVFVFVQGGIAVDLGTPNCCGELNFGILPGACTVVPVQYQGGVKLI